MLQLDFSHSPYHGARKAPITTLGLTESLFCCQDVDGTSSFRNLKVLRHEGRIRILDILHTTPLERPLLPHWVLRSRFSGVQDVDGTSSFRNFNKVLRHEGRRGFPYFSHSPRHMPLERPLIPHWVLRSRFPGACVGCGWNILFLRGEEHRPQTNFPGKTQSSTIEVVENLFLEKLFTLNAAATLITITEGRVLEVADETEC